jgi:hypothetical protein
MQASIKIFITVVLTFCLISANSLAEGTVVISNDQFDKDKFRSFLREYVFQTYKSEKGVHIESVLSALGALSGFAVQQAIREEKIENHGLDENKVFVIIRTKDRSKYYFGDIFDQPLFDTRQGYVSIWSVISGSAKQAGAQKLPDINWLARQNVLSLGTPHFGELTVSKNHLPLEHPKIAIEKHWHLTEKLLLAYNIKPDNWGIEIASVAADIIILVKEALPPEIAAQLVIQPAISMSKIDPNSINVSKTTKIDK